MSWNVVDRYGIDMSGNSDNAGKLLIARTEIASMAAAKKPLPRLVFPEGFCAFSEWPNFAFHNLQMVAEGETVLRYKGTGDAVTFKGAESASGGVGDGARNIVFDGFKIDPGHKALDGLVLSSIHASNFKVNVLGAGDPRNNNPNSAIRMTFCVCTELHPTVSSLDGVFGGYGGSFDCNGLTLTTLPGHGELPVCACNIIRPVIEGVRNGIYGVSSFFNEVRGGTIEQCKFGAIMLSGRGDLFDHVEMEGNTEYDVWCAKDYHDNVFMYCGDGHRRSFKTKIEGYLTNNQIIPIGSLWT